MSESTIDLDAVKEDTKKLYEKYKELIDLHKSPDMSTDKVISRIRIVSMMGGTTRTTALGSLFYTAMVAPIAGLDKTVLLSALNDAYDAAAALPTTPALAAEYKEQNKAALEMESQYSDGKAVMVPGSGKVH